MTLPNYENILVDSSRALADMVVDQVGTDSEQLTELYRLAMEEKGKLAMRAARVFDLVDEKQKGMAADYVVSIMHNLLKISHSSVLRCFLRTLSRYPLPEDEDLQSVLYEAAYELLKDKKRDVAIRYYGMLFTYRMACYLPDLRFELFPLYDELALEGGKGMRHRAEQFTKDLITKFGAE